MFAKLFIFQIPLSVLNDKSMRKQNFAIDYSFVMVCKKAKLPF